ncbi:MAG: hypothetical protein AAF184_23810 [Pseudomonadota bacterium]
MMIVRLLRAGTWLALAGWVGVAAASPTLLDVDVPLLDQGLPVSRAQQLDQGIYPEIRRVEAQYFAVELTRALVDTARFGTIRVVPSEDTTAELTVRGKILRSDGRELELSLVAIDATGRRWLERDYYIATPVPLTSPDDKVTTEQQVDALQPLYARITTDLIMALDAHDERDLTLIREISQLRYAAALAPQPFAAYVEWVPPQRAPRSDDPEQVLPPLMPPHYRAVRLPSAQDPMIARIARVRLTEAQLKDTSHQLYVRAVDEVSAGYETWRRFNAQQLAYVEEREGRFASTSKKERKRRRKARSYSSYKQSYEDYRWAKEQEQRMAAWAARLDTQASPTVQEVEGTLVELEGSLAEQYAEWRRILRALFELETGVATAP